MNTTTGWIVGVIIVLLLIAGGWWLIQPGSPTSENAGFATTTTSGNNQAPIVFTNRPNDTVDTVVASLASESQAAAILSSTGVSGTLSGKGPYTVFISTDAGFNLLPKGTITNMTSAQKKRLAQYSVVGKLLNVSATDSGTVQALSGDPLNFNVQDSGLVQVNSSFVLEQYKTKNGIVYVINQPLLPPVKNNY